MDYNMMSIKNVLITGGCGFIGSNYLNFCVKYYPNIIFHNVDKLDYCANINNLDIVDHQNYKFYNFDINNSEFINYILKENKIDVVIHFAAQTHVDSSFDNSIQYTLDNIIGTHTLLESCRLYGGLKRFIHMSTDEVYGEVNIHHQGCYETDVLNPTNPYSATKASAEMLVNSYIYSYKFPAITIRCNNVYGPNQYPEKIIPKFIKLLKENKKLTIHGNGLSRRSYIHVYDVIKAIDIILYKGNVGEIYNIGTKTELTVLEIAYILIKMIKNIDYYPPYLDYVTDRPFNDFRYVVNFDKLLALGWYEECNFIDCLNKLTLTIL